MIGIVYEAAFMGNDDIDAFFQLSIALITDVLDETLNRTARDETVIRNLIYTGVFQMIEVIQKILGDHKIGVQFIVGVEYRKQ